MSRPDPAPIALRWRLYRVTPAGRVFLWGTRGKPEFRDADMVAELRRKVPSLRTEVIGVERISAQGIERTEFPAVTA